MQLHPYRPTLLLVLLTLFALLVFTLALQPVWADVGFSAGFPAQVHAANPDHANTNELWIEAVPDVLLVRVAPGIRLDDALAVGSTAGLSTESVSLADMLQQRGVVNIRPLMPDTASVATAQGIDNIMARTYALQFAPAVNLAQVRQELDGLPDVEMVEPDYMARPALVPNDAQYGQQWALPLLGMPGAWDKSTGSSDIVIALIDSGVDTTHPDLASRLWVNPGEIAGNGLDDDGNGYVDDVHGWNFVSDSSSIADAYGHGTQVAGVAAAVGNNGIGIAGICWQCKLMVVTAMQNGGVANYSDIAAAVAYAASNGARVINLSLGGYADSATLREAISEAARMSVLVGGAGNDDSSAPFYPAAYPEVIAVAAGTETNAKTVFSNYGPWVTLVAPGAAIRTTANGSGYVTQNGTSLATAYVAGAAGLVAALHPTWPPDLIRWHLRNTATVIDSQNAAYIGQLGSGRLDVGKALAVNPQPAGEVVGFTVDGQAEQEPAPGQSFDLVVNVLNRWQPGQNLNGVLSTTSSHATLSNASHSFGNIESGKLGSNNAAPFPITLKATTPYGAQIPLRLTLNGSGGYQLILNFTLRVRSAVETLGNTQYTSDVTWTSDKRYVLNGTVIVAEGANLTIQPGTEISVAPQKFLRVDGTLIARGTENQPITFASSSNTGERWSGVRFTTTAVDAVFNGEGVYQAGSIVQFVEVSDAERGFSLNGRAPYIADSTFRRTPIAVESGGNQVIRLERNTVEDGYVQVGGAATLTHNVFLNLVPDDSAVDPECGIVVGGGSPLILQNMLAGCSIIGSGQNPAVISNTVRGGEIRLTLDVASGSGMAAVPSYLPTVRYTAISAGGDHTCAITTLGAAHCWGYNEQGQLGDNTFEQRATPTEVVGLGSGIIGIAAGWRHTCALVTGGGVKCWGYNEFGQLGDNTNTNRNTPVDVMGLTSGVVAIAAGEHHTCALSSGGGVKCWGLNANNQLGDGTNEQRNAPVDVVDLGSGVSAIATGGSHTCALTTGGGVKCWGTDTHGQLGDEGINENKSTPVNVTGLTGGVVRIAAGARHSCAVTSAGGLKCWGYNGDGQLGNSTLTFPDSPTPVDVTELSSGVLNVTASATGYHTCALTTTGGVKCWGRNDQGQVGDDTIQNQRKTPVNVSGLDSGGASISAGGNHTCVVMSDGVGKCWGFNFYNQLGNSGSGNSTVPMDIVAGDAYIQGNSVYASAGMNIVLNDVAGEVLIRHNTIGQNLGPGLSLSGLTSGDGLLIHNNNLFANTEYDLLLAPGEAGTQNFTVDLSGNFWRVPNEQIGGRVRDCTFDDNGCNNPAATLAKVSFTPALTTPDPSAPAFITSVALNPSPVGIQQGTLTVDFSAPMIVASPPVVTFHDARRGTTQPMLPLQDSVNEIATDVLGRVWVSSDRGVENGSGARVFESRAWMTYTVATSGLASNGVSAIFAAKNGDIWFAHFPPDPGSPPSVPLSRLRGSTWMTFTQTSSEIRAIGEELTGALWFATANNDGLYRYDGITWQHITVEEGLADNFVVEITRDGQGNMWFQTSSGLSVFDGSNWTFHAPPNGSDHTRLTSLYADSQGRIWIGLDHGAMGTDDSPYLGMFDGSAWHYLGAAETNGLVSCAPSSFTEAPDGALWLVSCGRLLRYQNGAWSQMGGDLSYAENLLFDHRGNLWFSGSTGMGMRAVSVLWGGLDYPFAGGQWLSPTRFQTTFGFTAALLPGAYAVKMEGAVDASGMRPYTEKIGNFTIAFGGGVALNPPQPPVVLAESSASLTTISSSWQANGEQIDQYRYAIGTMPYARDVVGWTYLTGTSFTRTDLSLVQGQTYYVTVQARNRSTLWSGSGVSNAVVAGAQVAGELFLPAIVR